MAPPKKEKLRVIEVDWVDAYGGTGWLKAGDIDLSPAIIKTVGLQFEKTKDYIAVVQSYGRKCNDWDNFIQIPMGMIKKIKQIGVVEV